MLTTSSPTPSSTALAAAMPIFDTRTAAAAAVGNNDGSAPDRGPAVFAVSVATLTAASAFVAARFVSRYFIVRCVRWDDCIMALAWLIAVFLTFTIAYGTAHGLGSLDEDIEVSQRGILRRCEYVFSILYVSASKSGLEVMQLSCLDHTS